MLIHIKKHPTHNPAIYVGKFFGAIAKGIGFIYELIRKIVLFIVNLLITCLEFLQKKLKERRLKKLEEKAKKEAENEAEKETETAEADATESSTDTTEDENKEASDNEQASETEKE